MNRQPDIIPAGDRALSIVFPEEISEEISCRVLDMCAAIDAAHSRNRGMYPLLPHASCGI